MNMITHLSKNVCIRLSDGPIRLPIEVHKTYCNQEVRPSEIDNEQPSCAECSDWLVWNEIDSC